MIVVGGRLAGVSAAIHLTKQGRSVLVLEKESILKDVLSTHFMWPRGASYLNRLGILDQVVESAPFFEEVDLAIEDASIRSSVSIEDLRSRFRMLHGDDGGVTGASFSARRHLLDDIVARYAVKCGVDYRYSAKVTDLVREDGRVAGVRWRSHDGKEKSALARVVLGADGRRSRVARLTGARKVDERENCTFACYTYFSSLSLTTPTMHRRGRLGVALCPTSENQTMALVYGPSEWYQGFRRDPEGNFVKALQHVDGKLASAVADGERQAGFFMTNDQSAYIREVAGDGWALVGDAASFTDQCTASGMSHALRDAELIAQTVGLALASHGDISAALAEYRELRHRDAWSYYEFVATQAEMQAASVSEVELYRAVSLNPVYSRRLISVFSGATDPDALFSIESVQEILGGLSTPGADLPKDDTWNRSGNPFVADSADDQERLALTHTTRSFASPAGSRLLERTESFHQWYRARVESETWLYSRTLTAAPRSTTRLVDSCNRVLEGINFASQDYLGLSSHPAVIEAATSAIAEYGVHSAGSAVAVGNTPISRALEQDIAGLLEMEHVTLFPTGWAAAYGPINALVRPGDHVVMDRFAHASLSQAAYGASRNVHRVPHLDTEATRVVLGTLRRKDQRNGILVVTEGLYSMDADSPDLERLQDLCHEYEATLLVDVAHDLGATGPGGQGQIGIQKLLGRVDLVMGSFSKTFASNGGFVATNSAAARSYIEVYGTSHVFSNALSPAQTAAVRAALAIATSDEGGLLRENLLTGSIALRDALAAYELPSLGNAGPIVPVVIGDERVARLTFRGLRPRGVAAGVAEYPIVPAGASRLRLQVMPSHTPAQAKEAAALIADVVAEARAAVNSMDSSSAGRCAE